MIVYLGGEVKLNSYSYIHRQTALETVRSDLPQGAENLTRDPPPEFICPLSGGLMRDPVMIETKHNYDRDYIEAWFSLGHRVCPASGVAVLTTTTLPNHLLEWAIRDWVKVLEDARYSAERVGGAPATGGRKGG